MCKTKFFLSQTSYVSYMSYICHVRLLKLSNPVIALKNRVTTVNLTSLTHIGGNILYRCNFQSLKQNALFSVLLQEHQFFVSEYSPAWS